MSAKSKIIISEQGIHFKYGLRNRRVNWNDINSVYSDSSLQQIIIETSLKKHVLVQRWWTNKQRLSFAQVIAFFHSDFQIKASEPITRELLKQEFSKDLGKNTGIFAWLSLLLLIVGGYVHMIFDPYQTVEHGYFGVLILILAGLSFAFAYSKIKTTPEPEMKFTKKLICFIFSVGVMYFSYGALPWAYDLYAKPVSTPFTLISQRQESDSEIWQDHSGLNFNCFISTRSLQQQLAVDVIHAPLGMIRLQAKMVCIPRR